MKLKSILTATCLGLFATTFSVAETSGPAESEQKPAHAGDDRPVVQLAILLDNSGSMSGLIRQAKTQIWGIVNQFATAKENGKSPRLEVAIYEYGINNAQDDKSYMHQLLPLSEDLDMVSQRLFDIKESDAGCEEFCGQVIQKAIDQLAWSNSPKTYRAIFIAGNEPFTQGGVDYRSACKAAIKKGIIVNTIHCGDERSGIDGKWKAAADMSDGKFLIIDHNTATVSIDAPQDKEIAELNSKLNDTYIAYGARGAAGKANQEKQDANAAAMPGGTAVMASRAGSKASKLYSTRDWDLVDRAKDKNFDLEKLAESELPEEMRKLAPAERTAYIEKKAKQREEIQAKIKQLSDERSKFVAEKSREESGKTTLGTAVNKAVRQQAEKKGLSFGE